MSHDNDDRDSGFGRERRKLMRHPMVSLVWYRIVEDVDILETKELEGISKMCDISQSGLGLYTPREIQKDKLVFLEVNTKTDGNFSAVGRVVNVSKVDETYYRIGVRFIVVPPNDHLLLRKLFGSER